MENLVEDLFYIERKNNCVYDTLSLKNHPWFTIQILLRKPIQTVLKSGRSNNYCSRYSSTFSAFPFVHVEKVLHHTPTEIHAHGWAIHANKCRKCRCYPVARQNQNNAIRNIVTITKKQSMHVSIPNSQQQQQRKTIYCELQTNSQRKQIKGNQTSQYWSNDLWFANLITVRE